MILDTYTNITWTIKIISIVKIYPKKCAIQIKVLTSSRINEAAPETNKHRLKHLFLISFLFLSHEIT